MTDFNYSEFRKEIMEKDDVVLNSLTPSEEPTVAKNATVELEEVKKPAMEGVLLQRDGRPFTESSLICQVDMRKFFAFHKKRIEALSTDESKFNRIVSIAIEEISKNKDLLACTAVSILNAVKEITKHGLEIGGFFGHGYLVPFKNRKKDCYECTPILGYKGMIALAYRSKELKSINCRVVHEGDLFEYEYGLNEKLIHRPSNDPNNTIVTHAYCVAQFVNGGYHFEVMSIAELNVIRNRSRANQYGPWVTDTESMYKKTVLRRANSYLPKSIDVMQEYEYQDGEIDVTPKKEVSEDKKLSQMERLAEEL